MPAMSSHQRSILDHQLSGCQTSRKWMINRSFLRVVILGSWIVQILRSKRQWRRWLESLQRSCVKQGSNHEKRLRKGWDDQGIIPWCFQVPVLEALTSKTIKRTGAWTSKSMNARSSQSQRKRKLRKCHEVVLFYRVLSSSNLRCAQTRWERRSANDIELSSWLMKVTSRTRNRRIHGSANAIKTPNRQTSSRPSIPTALRALCTVANTVSAARWSSTEWRKRNPCLKTHETLYPPTLERLICEGSHRIRAHDCFTVTLCWRRMFHIVSSRWIVRLRVSSQWQVLVVCFDVTTHSHDSSVQKTRLVISEQVEPVHDKD